MALTERSRATLFRGLSEVLDDEEAVGELLSYFPARDVDEPASRDFVDARISAVEARFAAVDARFDSVDARFDSVDARFDSMQARMDTGFAELRGEMAALEQRMMATMHAEIRTMTQWSIGSMVAFVGLLVALGLIR
jgi:hypothetical protein